MSFATGLAFKLIEIAKPEYTTHVLIMSKEAWDEFLLVILKMKLNDFPIDISTNEALIEHGWIAQVNRICVIISQKFKKKEFFLYNIGSPIKPVPQLTYEEFSSLEVIDS
jgi:hypothetical protein